MERYQGDPLHAGFAQRLVDGGVGPVTADEMPPGTEGAATPVAAAAFSPAGEVVRACGAARGRAGAGASAGARRCGEGPGARPVRGPPAARPAGGARGRTRHGRRRRRPRCLLAGLSGGRRLAPTSFECLPPRSPAHAHTHHAHPQAIPRPHRPRNLRSSRRRRRRTSSLAWSDVTSGGGRRCAVTPRCYQVEQPHALCNPIPIIAAAAPAFGCVCRGAATLLPRAFPPLAGSPPAQRPLGRGPAQRTRAIVL